MSSARSRCPLPQLLAVILVGGLALGGFACATTGGGETSTPARDSAQDPLVRERVIKRMEELYAPAKAEAAKVRQMTAKRECDGLGAMSGRICNASARICELAADYPESDEEVQETCTWATADCDGSRGSCAGCGGDGTGEE